MIEILVHGYTGKMGNVITRMIQQEKNMQVSAGVDQIYSKTTMPFPTFLELAKVDMPVDMLLDFSHPTTISDVLDFALNRKIATIIGTTGLSPEAIKNIEIASQQIPIIYAANTALGFNLVASILQTISRPLFDLGFDIEIIESHHKEKIDAPSGSALDLVALVSGELKDTSISFSHERQQKIGKRDVHEIGVHSIRGGTIFGEHEIIFAGLDENISIKHTALSKNVYGLGAIAAASFLAHKDPGLYTMDDVIREKLNNL